MDRWDLEVRGGPLGGARLRAAVEEHGEGKQLVRIGLWPRVSILAVGLAAVFAPLATKAAVDGAIAAASVLGGLAALVLASHAQGLRVRRRRRLTCPGKTAPGARRPFARGLRERRRSAATHAGEQEAER